MKEVLIYGALVAAVIAAAIPMIGDVVAESRNQSTAIRGEIRDRGGALVTAIQTGEFGADEGGDGGEG